MVGGRSVFYIDGSNWFHGLVRVGLQRTLALDYKKISEKLAGPGRQWVGTRYYVGRLSSTSPDYANQRKLESQLSATDKRISMHFGRLEPHQVENEAAKEILTYVYGLSMKIDAVTFRELVDIAKKHRKTTVWKEKAVDVQLAIDMVVMANRDEYDVAYLLSADGDFTGAVNYVRSVGKTVFAASAQSGAQLAAVVNKFIPLDRDWFNDCY